MSVENFKALSESFAEARILSIDADRRVERYDLLPSFGNESFDPDKRINPDASKLFLEDIIAVFEGFDEYTFEGKECFVNDEVLDHKFLDFTPEKWETLTDVEKKEKITNLCEYISQKLDIKNLPEVTFIYEDSSFFGGFSGSDNKLYINEKFLDNPFELVDTIAHELRHAFQFQCALNPETMLDEMYAVNFEFYIRPEDDYMGYKSQLVESEASAFAYQFKSELIKLSGGDA